MAIGPQFFRALCLVSALTVFPQMPASAASGDADSYEMAQGNSGGGRNQGGRDQGGGGSQASCGSREVAQAEQQTGGKMMSVSQSGGACRITVLIPPQGNGKPRRQTVTIRH